MVTRILLTSWPRTTSDAKQAILDALIQNRSRHTLVTDAISREILPANYLTADHRSRLLKTAGADQVPQLRTLLDGVIDPERAVLVGEFIDEVEDLDEQSGIPETEPDSK